LVGSSIFCCDALLLGLFASVCSYRWSWGLVVSLVVGSTYQSVLLVRCRFYLVLLAAVTLFSWWSCSSSPAELPGCFGHRRCVCRYFSGLLSPPSSSFSLAFVIISSLSLLLTPTRWVVGSFRHGVLCADGRVYCVPMLVVFTLAI
jgi:hypothetical protein